MHRAKKQDDNKNIKMALISKFISAYNLYTVLSQPFNVRRTLYVHCTALYVVQYPCTAMVYCDNVLAVRRGNRNDIYRSGIIVPYYVHCNTAITTIVYCI